MNQGRFSYLRALPWLVLGLGLLATYGAWKLFDTSITHSADRRFEQEVRATEHAILDRLHAYETILRGTVGMFYASDDVTRAEFKTFIDILQLQRDYPGILGIGYSPVISAADLAAHEAGIRAEGFPDYSVTPADARDAYSPIVYVEPFDERNQRVFGFDMNAEPIRREAQEKARDTGDTAISGKLALVQEINAEAQPGFVMFMPIYRGARDPVDPARRRAELTGYVHAAFRSIDLMNGIRQSEGSLVNFALYDGPAITPEALLYDDRPAIRTDSAHEQITPLNVAGRRWTAIFTEAADFRVATDSDEPNIVVATGVTISVILFVIFLMMHRIIHERRRAAETLLAAERQVMQAQKMESIGQLTGGIAHDFNNLLTVVMGNAELLSEQLEAQESLLELSETIRSAAERGAGLTSRLLAFARRQPLDPKAVDVNSLLTGMEPLLRRTLGAHIELKMLPADALWDALIDVSQLEGALLNLSINARDAMPDGGRLIIETGNVHLDQDYADQNAELVPGDYVLVAVSDTGTGMTPEVIARAFEPFFTTKPHGTGSGLGLSMVYGFVKQSHGHIKIYSEPGHGTALKLYLPRLNSKAERSASASAKLAPQGGTAKILVVEDDDLVRQNVTAQLQRLGYRTVVASTGPEAIETLKEHPDIDLLFTDVVMPGGMSGRQVADAARTMRPGLPVLFTSGYTENAIVHNGRLDAGVHLLNKPYRRQDLADKIRAVLIAADSSD